MTVEFPRQRQPKPAGELPCTTRTIQGQDHRLAQMWEGAEASLQTEISQEVLAEASAIALAERARSHLHEALRAGSPSLHITCLGGAVFQGRVIDGGIDWVLIAHENRLVTGVQLSTVVRMAGLEHRLPTEASQPLIASTWKQWLRSLVDPVVGIVQMVTVDGWASRAEILYVSADFVRIATEDGQQSDVMLRALSAVTVMSTRRSG